MGPTPWRLPPFGQCTTSPEAQSRRRATPPPLTNDPVARGATLSKPESTEGRPWGQPLKKPAGAPLNLG